MDSQGAALSSSEGTRPRHVETTPEYPSLQASVLWVTALQRSASEPPQTGRGGLMGEQVSPALRHLSVWSLGVVQGDGWSRHIPEGDAASRPMLAPTASAQRDHTPERQGANVDQEPSAVLQTKDTHHGGCGGGRGGERGGGEPRADGFGRRRHFYAGAGPWAERPRW